MKSQKYNVNLIFLDVTTITYDEFNQKISTVKSYNENSVVYCGEFLSLSLTIGNRDNIRKIYFKNLIFKKTTLLNII